ncbi:hypothetical protein METBIDRAFT_33568 [Metschnikowia bicuspidata var. bicuspidata NRRL YB-4993]|uniref:C2H2-type domain-containing protein n=1 Tax=Metschnikowia bicuspidata var. bicuspidata NRRL YB-4993 TaxID=869754 RepID=A0A1A0H5N9_9ASCO|nr:hypothetical protein METBIDRAFT_33568 [Metschnikowia bicuspidata var. bicuspidata NRRL YB-4993]OBA19404.1 hypothetical protein METBIDRAFT_33568 [Metschnikowia bicuspidata var. bicuspidata NRRL YB-4993]
MFNTGIFDNSSAPQDAPAGDAFLNVPQPIDITYQRQPSIFNSHRFRRESIAHSQGMGGVSWGSVTIGSWLKDEVMMQGAHQPAAHHASLINPRRGLFRYVNPAHPHHHMLMSPPNTTSYLPKLEADYCKDYSCCDQLLPTLHDLLRHYEEAHISSSPPADPSAHLLTSHHSRNNMNSIHNVMETVSTNDVFLNNHAQMPHAQGHMAAPANHFNLQQHALALGNLNQTILPSLTMTGGPDQPARPQGVPPLLTHQGSLQDRGAARARTAQQLGEDDSMYIDDPARHLYVMENEEYKPFKCPVIGCEKTYKNQNGLKYHRLHGHQNQTLKENEDGTISIIDPESNTPFLDGAGMEKDKPYRCEVCGKRYKNLNGLKYHRGHTTH